MGTGRACPLKQSVGWTDHVRHATGLARSRVRAIASAVGGGQEREGVLQWCRWHVDTVTNSSSVLRRIGQDSGDGPRRDIYHVIFRAAAVRESRGVAR